MLILYLIDRYLRKKDDSKFIRFWETRILSKARYYGIIVLIYYGLAVWLIVRILLWGNDSFFLGFLVFVFTAMIYGYYFIRNIVRFFALNNQRYIMAKSGFSQDTFDKSNVVN